MMYNLVKKMTNVSHFLAIKNKELFVHNNDFSIDDNIYNVLPMLFLMDITKNNIWIKDNNWENYLLNIAEKKLKKLDFNIGLNGIISDIIVIFKDNIQSCFSTKKLKIIVNFPKVEKIKTYLSNDKNIFFQVENCLKSLSLLTGLYEWEINLSIEGLKVGGILGVAGTNLLVACTNEQHQGIWLSLDVATGKEVWRQHLQISYGGTYAFKEDKTSAIILNAGGFWLNGIQVAKGNNIFREINTKDGSIKREGVLWQLDEAGLGIHNCTLHEGFIYFTAVYQSFGATVLGVLDYETLSLLWWEEVKMDEADGFGNFFLNQPLQVAENKIYVLDKTHVLHIYERDETLPFEKPTKSGLLAFEDLPIPEKPTQNEPYYPTEDDIPF